MSAFTAERYDKDNNFMDRLIDTWQKPLDKFRNYIKFERRLSNNTVAAYMHDLNGFAESVIAQGRTSPAEVDPEAIEAYLGTLYDKGVGKRSQSRILSCLKSFFKYMLLTETITESPAEFIEHPKLGLHLPDVLTVEEIGRIFSAVDTSTEKGQRNRAILEVLYGCGIRVSELVGMKIQDLHLEDRVVFITGKGNKQRLVPICDEAIRQVCEYLRQRECPDSAYSQYLFLNRFGRPLSRIAVFDMVKEVAMLAGITKSISPHTFRHSFATHLLHGGASIRQVQVLLGHESITTTEIYTHLDIEFLRNTLEQHHPLASKE